MRDCYCIMCKVSTDIVCVRSLAKTGDYHPFGRITQSDNIFIT